ncbi:MAG: CoA-binding protein [Sandaracinaceae bacterium]
MAHPLQEVMRTAGTFLLIGDSSEDRFPGFSYHNYTQAKMPFYCLDLGGLTESRGPTKGGKVYTKIEDVPDDVGDLAVIWVKPRSAKRAVEIAHGKGCTRVWFSFGTGHPEAVGRARELGMEVVEIGRCPVFYMDEPTRACSIHTGLVKLTGVWARPPQTDPDVKRREIW